MYLLDTNTCIGYLNGTAIHVLSKMQTTPAQEIAVCSVVKAELFYGAMKSTHPAKVLTEQKKFLDQFSPPCHSMTAQPMNMAVSEHIWCGMAHRSVPTTC